ncbi:MAG: UMP kinase [Clostridia bacterium]
MFKRILVKLSGEALERREYVKQYDEFIKTDNLDFSMLSRLANELKAITESGVQTAVVLGGGNIWRGRNAKNRMERNNADHMGMLATTINSIALADVLMQKGVKAKVFSATDMRKFCDLFSPYAADEALNAGMVAVFAGGSGLPFFTTDTAAALRACEIHAEALFLAKNIDAVYDKDPNIFKDAVKLSHPTYDELIALNVRAVDQTTITLCRDNAMPFYVFKLEGENCIENAVKLKNIGTFVEPD